MAFVLPYGEHRVLTLRQPWAWLVAEGYKHIENRKWSTKFRGDFLIHAASDMTNSEWRLVSDFAADRGVIVPKRDELHFGVLLAVATLVDVLMPDVDVNGSETWHLPGQYGFVLEGIAPLARRVPCKGHLNFWRFKYEAPSESILSGSVV